MKAFVVIIENEERMTRLLDELLAHVAEGGGANPRPDPALCQPEALLTWRTLELDPTARRAFVAKAEVPLTKIEFDVLHLLMSNRGRAFTRRDLLDRIWGYAYEGYDKAINGHIMNLRRKLGIDCIETVRGVGYRFTASR